MNRRDLLIIGSAAIALPLAARVATASARRDRIDESMAVAIDGEIFQDAYLAQLKP